MNFFRITNKGIIAAPAPAKDKTITIQWSKQKAALSEIYSQGMQFSFFNSDGEQCHQFVLCKDFLHDAVHATIHNTTSSIYGFSYNPKTCPKISLDRIRILATNSQDENFLNKIPAVIDFINQFEKHFGLIRTTARTVANPQGKYTKCGVAAFRGSERWMMAPPMLSLYTLLIRAGFAHKIGTPMMETVNGLISGKINPYQKNDASYLRSAKPAIDKMMKLGYRVFFFGEIEKNYPKDASIGTLHGSAGIVAMANGSSSSLVKHWTRKQIQERLDGTYVPKPKDEVVEVE